MNHLPDDHQPPDDGTGGRGEGNPKLDEDAAWRDIIANYEDTAPHPLIDPGQWADPVADDPDQPASADSLTGQDWVVDPAETTPPVNPSLFDRSHLDPLNSEASWDDEGHFVPPTPPPLPTIEPRRKIAWIALFGVPVLMLVSAAFRYSFPGWLSFLMVIGFVGGFIYLVATMPRKRHDDWSGDDGAVV